MVTDHQVRKLFKLANKERSVEMAASKVGMDRRTARKYLRIGKQPSEVRRGHDWRTRQDPFAEVWEPIREQLTLESGLEAKTLFDWLQREHPGRFSDGQLRTLQRRIQRWRGTEGPGQEVYF